MNINFTFGKVWKCHKCGCEFGETNLMYKDARIWMDCKCSKLDKDSMYFINTDNIKIKNQRLNE